MLLSAIACLFGVGLLVALMFKMAIFALPLFVGVTAGRLAIETGAGLPGALLLGALAAVACFVGARRLFTGAHPTSWRMALALAFAAPSAFAGYFVVLAFARLGGSHPPWQEIFAGVGALAVGFAALTRLTAPSAARPMLIGAPSGSRF